MESITGGVSKGTTEEHKSLESETLSNQEPSFWGSFLGKIFPTRINPKVVTENLISYNSILELKEVQDINPLDDPDADPTETLRKVRNLNERGCCSKAYIRPIPGGRCCPPPTPPIPEEKINQISQIVDQETNSIPRPPSSRKIKLRRHHHRPTHSEEDEFQTCNVCKGPICSHGGPQRFSESGCCFRPCDDSCDSQTRQQPSKNFEKKISKASNKESLPDSKKSEIKEKKSENSESGCCFRPCDDSCDLQTRQQPSKNSEKQISKASNKESLPDSKKSEIKEKESENSENLKTSAKRNINNSLSKRKESIQTAIKETIQTLRRESTNSTTLSEDKNNIKSSGKKVKNPGAEREENNKNLPLPDINKNSSNANEKLIVKDVVYCGDSIKALNIVNICDNERQCTLPSLDIAKAADDFATVLIGNDSCPFRKKQCHNENIKSNSAEQINEDIFCQSKSVKKSNECCDCCKNKKESKSAFDSSILKSNECQKPAESIKCRSFEEEAKKCQEKSKNQVDNPCSKESKSKTNSQKECHISKEVERKSTCDNFDNNKDNKSYTEQLKDKMCAKLCPEDNKNKTKGSEDTKNDCECDTCDVVNIQKETKPEIANLIDNSSQKAGLISPEFGSSSECGPCETAVTHFLNLFGLRRQN